MNECIAFSIESEDKLRRETWRFWLHDFRLVLDSYAVESRPSRRHAYKVVSSYERIVPRGFLKEADVPLPSEVRERAIREFASKITVARWSEVGR